MDDDEGDEDNNDNNDDNDGDDDDDDDDRADEFDLSARLLASKTWQSISVLRGVSSDGRGKRSGSVFKRENR